LRVGNGPGKMAVGDGQFLYVALDLDSAISRLRLDSLAPDLRFSVGARVVDMEVLPGAPSTIAVSRWDPNMGVVIYSNGVARAQTTSVPSVYAGAIAFSDSPATLYAYDNETSGFALYSLLVGPNGVSLSKTWPGLISGYGVDIEFAGSRIYATSGAVVDPVSGTVSGR